MRLVKILCICLVFSMFFSFAFLPNGVAADSKSEVTNVSHVPKYPMVGDDVTVYATITDSDGINSIELGHCDEFVCYGNVPMTPLGDDVYTATILWNNDWGNETIIGYDFWVLDNGTNYTITEYTYYFFVSEINLSTGMEDTVYVGDVVTLNGTAYYNGNENAPVENSNVTVKIVGTAIEYRTMTDNEGNFSYELSIMIPGDYAINTTVSNRTLKGYYEVSVTVIGITYLSIDLQMTTCYPSQDIWVNGTARYSTEDFVMNSDVEIRINETLFWPGNTDSSGNYSILITAPTEVDQYTVNVTVVNGTLEAYNEATISVTELPLPDLYVDGEDITFISTKNPPLPGDPVNISVLVQNLGSANCTDIIVHFYFGEPSEEHLIGSDTIGSILVGATDTASVLWEAVEGTHDIWVVVDPLNTTGESIEGNNNASRFIFVDEDTDGDGVGNVADTDDDGDGMDDSNDAFPLDPAASVDTDSDGKPDDWNEGKTSSNSTTNLTLDSDDDDDGFNDPEDAFPQDPSEWLDTDGDVIGNNADEDDDGDGLSDTQELANNTDPMNPDTDGDEVNDKDDYDPLDSGVWEKPSSSSWNWFIILVSIIITFIAILVVFLIKRKGSG